MPADRGFWQLAKAPATAEEIQAVIQELSTRNVFHSQATIEGRAAAAAAKRTEKATSIVIWGGVGLAALLMGIYALK